MDSEVHASESSAAVVAVPRLQAHAGNARLLRSPLGAVVARPWIDRVTLGLLRRLFFPLSRTWAAADAALGDVDAYWAAIAMPRRHEQRDRLARVLRSVAETRLSAEAVDVAWDRAFFGPTPPPVAQLVAIETARHNRRDAHNRTRAQMLPLLTRSTPRARMTILTPADVAARDDLVDDPDALYAAPSAMPPVEVSHSVPGIRCVDSWLRFRSPSHTGDTCWARVHTPEGVTDPPTVILGHGICVEFDHWHGLLDETHALIAQGIRVIRPEAPWHGRRRLIGYYGGERTIGMFPTGMLDHFVAALKEWAVIADWVRRTSSAPLGFGGTSLGALTAQLAASVSQSWPERLRPDALYLITHSGTMSQTAMTGVPGTLFADPVQAVRRGWTTERAREVFARADPHRLPVVDPARIVSVLGSRDVITPFDGGETLLWRWGVPEANIFRFRNGHFTIPMRLVRDHAPTRRFAEVLRG